MDRRFIKVALTSSLISYAVVCSADDSEIFFSKDLSATKPNIIFLLDTSGSMGWPAEGEANKTRIDVLKESLENILTSPDVKDIRAGIMGFASSTQKIEEVIDIDEIDTSKDITKTVSGTNPGYTILQQRVLVPTDDGYQTSNTSGTYSRPTLTSASYTSETNTTHGFRFNNVLIENPNNHSITPADAIKKAELVLYTATTGARNINIYIDAADSAPHFRDFVNFFRQRVTASGSFISCSKPASTNYFTCDVTDLVRNKVSQPEWKDGNAIAFYTRMASSSAVIHFREGTGGSTHPQLKIEAHDSLIADNKITYRDRLVTQVFNLNANGGTSITLALYDAGRYISNISTKPNPGPYHDNKWGTSPLLEGCQKTHLVLMTDGEAGGAHSGTIAPYINQTANACKVFTDSEGHTALETTAIGVSSIGIYERCGRALVSWMARVSQSNLPGGNYVNTHTIGFSSGVTSSSQKFLNELAHYGLGDAKSATNASQLTQAFKDIVGSALVVDSPTASGRVTQSPQSRYKQRTEVFYALYKSENTNYWPGNMKGFQIKYEDVVLTDGSTGKRAILYDDRDAPAMGADGIIKNTAFSFWAKTGATADGGKVDAGGVVAMLPNTPTTRNLYTIKSNGATEKLESTANLTTTDLDITGTDAEAVKKGLLDFIRGYTYVVGGSSIVADKKIGDSARSGVTLATYGCNTTPASETKGVLECDFDNLSQVALLAGNDGFIRGYNVSTGETLYEYMPKEMLPLIKGLQAKKTLSITEARFYGLDGNMVVYHDDINNDGYIDSGEAAYAYAVAGRGGSYIYALNISSKSAPILAWQISNLTPGFDKLGATWSVPVVGKIKIDNTITPVLIFGGGYDISQDNSAVRKTDNVGNALYIVNAKTGAIIWSTSANMQYSIPSSVAIVTDDTPEKLITDIFFGDMGGQLWRFAVNNGSQGNALVKPAGGDNGIIAKFAGDTVETSRRFYHAPVVYKFNDKDTNFNTKLAVSIASGYRAHPLATETQDRIYSLRVPRLADASSNQPITEANLAVASADGQTLENAANIEHGFMIRLGIVGTAAGEKVVSDGFSDFDRVVFNTYIPTKTVNINCTPGAGTQRTYNFNVKTGISLLETPYLETSVSTLPPDATAYCDGNYCTIVADPSQLSKDKPLPKGKDGVDPFVVKTGSGAYVKIGWTNIFDLVIN